MAARAAAEHLTVLLNYSEGILARLHRQISLFEHGETKPPCLQSKELEATIKQIMKKFPIIEAPKQGQQSPFFLQREQIQTQLGDSYFMLVDVIEFHNAVNELLQNLSEMQFHFDASINIKLTSQFLNLMANYTSILELLSRFPDRKLVAGCFQCSYEMLQGVGEPAYAAVSSFLVDFSSPFAKLPEMFAANGFEKLLYDTIMTIKPIFDVRYLTPQMLRKDSPYNISKTPHTIGVPTSVEEIAQELIPIDSMVRWICITFTLVPGTLTNERSEEAVDMLSRALSDGYMLPLYREHTLNIFKAYEQVFSSPTGSTKPLKKISKGLLDLSTNVNTDSGQFHLERRQFLIGALRQLHLLMKDKPGLLGPKCSTVLAALTFARGEIMWLFRHRYAAEKLQARKKMPAEVLEEPRLCELMFWCMELRFVALDHRALIQRYFVEYLGLDAQELKLVIATSHFAEYEQRILGSFFDIVDKISGQVTIPANKLDGFRLDCRRITCGMSIMSSKNPIDKNKTLAYQLELMHFHSSLVDSLDIVMQDACGLPDLFYYRKEFVEVFEAALSASQQDRYLVAFSEYCTTFPPGTNDAVPTDKPNVTKEAANISHHVLTRVAMKAVELVNRVTAEMSAIDSKLLPSKAVDALAVRLAKGKTTKEKRAAQEQEEDRPGRESQGGDESCHGSAAVKRLRSLQQSLGNLCWTLNRHKVISVENIRVAPQEYLTELLEQSFANTLVGMLRGPREEVPARPSEVLQSIETYMGVLRHVEGYIDVDIITLFSNGLLDQTLFKVGGGGITLATKFIQFYLNLVLKLVPQGGILLSTSRKALCHLNRDADRGFQAQEYTDISELRALCTLIGPFGIKQLYDNLMQAVSASAIEIKRIVTENKTELDIIRLKTHLPDQCMNAYTRIRGMELFIDHCKIVGTVLTFREMVAEQCKAVFGKRIPFIFRNVEDWHTHGTGDANLNSLAFAAGIKSDVDPFLLQVFQPLCANAEVDYSTWSLYMVMSACALKALAYSGDTVFNPAYDSHENNAHLVATTLCEISNAVFTLTAVSPESIKITISDSQTEFLRVAAVLLIRLGSEGSAREGPRARDAVYVILDRFVKLSAYLTDDVLEEHFPYSLIRTSLHAVYKQLQQ